MFRTACIFALILFVFQLSLEARQPNVSPGDPNRRPRLALRGGFPGADPDAPNKFAKGPTITKVWNQKKPGDNTLEKSEGETSETIDELAAIVFKRNSISAWRPAPTGTKAAGGAFEPGALGEIRAGTWPGDVLVRAQLGRQGVDEAIDVKTKESVRVLSEPLASYVVWAEVLLKRVPSDQYSKELLSYTIEGELFTRTRRLVDAIKTDKEFWGKPAVVLAQAMKAYLDDRTVAPRVKRAPFFWYTAEILRYILSHRIIPRQEGSPIAFKR